MNSSSLTSPSPSLSASSIISCRALRVAVTSKLLYIISLHSLTPCYVKVGTAACMMKESIQALVQQ